MATTEDMRGESPPYRPPPSDRRLPLLAALGLGLVLAGGYAGYHWWAASPSTALPARPTPQMPAPAPATPRPRTASSGASAPQVRIVHKCVVQGKTSYSDAPCPEGSQADVMRLTIPPPVLPRPRPAPPPAAIATPEPTPEIARPTAAPAVPSNATECKQLDEFITQLDAAARQPLSMPQQDEIRRKRQNARDRQFAIRC